MICFLPVKFKKKGFICSILEFTFHLLLNRELYKADLDYSNVQNYLSIIKNLFI